MSIGDEATELRAIADRIGQTRNTLDDCSKALDQAHITVGALLHGTTTYEVAARAVEAAMATLAALDTALVEAERTIQDAADHHLGAHRPAAPVGSVRDDQATAPPPRTPSPSGIANRHGDRYPREALPYSDELPPRVRKGTQNAPLVAHIEIDGRLIGSITPRRGDVWTRDVMERVFELELNGANLVANHVEMKAAIILIQGTGTHAQVTLNHSPCGSEPNDRAGCDNYLPAFLPVGLRMTVLGTDARGAPFKRTYDGKADR
ncbi:DddA-like double-stranded DNA deaminase toxin [Actinokineospora sp. NBRC 105648]|uniref:DddA-like double-stranded DNA deaminase toxin n=1 Tax=Actinokineospora sp. NBRC 105648 TaxID=3032206 RepID=UPI0024A1AD1E|nr:DddA-like double-stranded DNA deaminase toxin [Actinokineospora sp. NBRC 105648]GLZ38335.1 hypothetical protein Acsp05_19590 [Actinokineospora sp. NBRC 105648]